MIQLCSVVASISAVGFSFIRYVVAPHDENLLQDEDANTNDYQQAHIDHDIGFLNFDSIASRPRT